MSSQNGKRKRFLSSTPGLYLSIVTTTLAVIIAVLILQSSPVLLVYYFAFTFFIATTAFVLRRRLATKTSRLPEEELPQPQKSDWKGLLLLFFVLLVILVGPLFLAGFLDPAAWFISVVSLASGISIADILFHFYTW